MKKSRFSEEQIVRILKEVEAGAKVGETCRKHGISEPTYYVWKTKFAGMEVSQLRHLKDLEAELARLKRMYADLALERSRTSSRESSEPGTARGAESGNANRPPSECTTRGPRIAVVTFGTVLPCACARRQRVDRSDSGAPEGKPRPRLRPVVRSSTAAPRLGQDACMARICEPAPEPAASWQTPAA